MTKTPCCKTPLKLVPHGVEGSFKVAFMGVGKMRRKERYFGRDVDSAELNHPMGHTNEMLVE